MTGKDDFIKAIQNYLKLQYGRTIENATVAEKFNATGKAVMGLILDDWTKTQEKYKEGKQAYYFSAEYLMGRALGNNLMNLGLYNRVKESLEEIGIDLRKIEEIEEDAGLGNGGLGRLAACFLDSSAALDLPLTGYGLRYEYGLFRQKIVNGFQVEEADNWLVYGDPWSIRCDEDSVVVEFYDKNVKAVPYDTPIIGYGTRNINKLRLWKSEPFFDFDFNAFNSQKYDLAVHEKNRIEDICRVLYPNDNNREGKLLRLQQQYFFVSASLKDIIHKFKIRFGDNFALFSKYHAIQLNDTHPVVAIPELMRLLMDEEGLSWDEAWKITNTTFAYTNHTILAEALEKWDICVFKELLPRIYEIIEHIDRTFIAALYGGGYDEHKIESMKIINHNNVHMARLAIHGSFSINGVAYLHTEIIKRRELKEWYELYPDKFHNITNGITPRRWMLLSNKELSQFITNLLGTERWVTSLEMLKELEKFKEDKEVLKRFAEIKTKKKEELAAYVLEKEGIKINPESIFDIQIKRLHEYKRQLLNAFHIVEMYLRLKENPNLDVLPRTYIFGAKAAPGYVRAKGIIKYINEIARVLNNDTDIKDKIRVVFIQNYSVSYAEKLFPAADVSEQISMAGKEASGTGNMKFMLNGTPTIGTFDGANVEIIEEAGIENNFIFGATVEELDRVSHEYNPKHYYEQVPHLRKVVDTLIDGTFDDNQSGMFKEIYDALIHGTHWHIADHYFLLKDFESYTQTHKSIDEAYRDKFSWTKKCWINLANSGKFSSDRSIREYADIIWGIEQNKI